MSYTRGQETFWNSLTMTFQNVYRLLWVCLLLGVFTFLASFYLLTPENLWTYVTKGVVWVRDMARHDGVFHAISNLDTFFIYERKLFLTHKTELFYGMVIAVAVSVAAMLGGLIYFGKRGRKLVEDIHLSGAELIGSKQFNKQARSLIKQQQGEIKKDTDQSAKRTKHQDNFRCTADKLAIPYDLLFEHVAAIGATGTGKSTVIKHRIDHARSLGDKGIVLDINGELYSQVGSENDVILSLFDKRTAFWDYSYENFENLEVDPIKIAEYLIANDPNDKPVWYKAPRLIMEELLVTSGSSAKLWELIQNPSENLIEHLYGIAIRAAGNKADTRTYYNIIISLILDCRFFGFLNHWPRQTGNLDPFSILKWTQDRDPRFVFIIVDEKDIAVMEPLLKLWFNIAIHGILCRTPYNDLPAIALIIDEMRSIGKLDLLPSALNRMRKYGGQGFFGYQSNYQIDHLYGANDAEAFRSGLGTKFVFNNANEKEAQRMAEAFGIQEVKRKSFSMTYGLTNHGDRETLGEQITTKQVITPTDIMKLPKGHFYIKARSLNPVKTRILYKNWVNKLPLHRDNHGYPERAVKMQLPSSVLEKADPKITLDQGTFLDLLPGHAGDADA